MPPPQPDPTGVRIIAAHQAATKAIRARVEQYIETSWLSLGQYRTADIDRWVARTLPVVLGSQRQIAALTDSYLARIVAVTLGKAPKPVGVPASLVTGAALRGVEPDEVYRRPANTVYTALSEGVMFDTAVQYGLTRALSIAVTDLQLAKTHTARYVFAQKQGVVGYARVISGNRTCGLCVDASGQTYHRGDLMPIHPGCNCDVSPVYGDTNPADAVNTDLLDEAATPLAAVVHIHGEIGPVLAVRGQSFTGPSDI